MTKITENYKKTQNSKKQHCPKIMDIRNNTFFSIIIDTQCYIGFWCIAQQLHKFIHYAMHHKCSYYLPPWNTTTIPLNIFPMLCITYSINRSLNLPLPFTHFYQLPLPSLWQPSVCFLCLWISFYFLRHCFPFSSPHIRDIIDE